MNDSLSQSRKNPPGSELKESECPSFVSAAQYPVELLMGAQAGAVLENNEK